MKLLSLSLLFTFLSLNVFSQDSENISEYLDDGGFSTSKNIVKLNLATIILGDLPFSYERMLGKHFSLEVGVGKLMGYYNPDLIEMLGEYFEDENKIINPKGGYSFVIFPRFYMGDRGPLWMYWGAKYRKRNFTFENKDNIIFTDVSANFGFQFPIYNRLTMDYNSGIGFRFQKDKQLQSDAEIINVTLPLAIKIGYLF